MLDETGKRYGKLTVTGLSSRFEYENGRARWRRRYWNVLCDCGKAYEIRGHRLRSAEAAGRVICCRACSFRTGLLVSGSNSPSWRGHGDITGEQWSQIRRGAESRNLCFEVTIVQAWELFLHQERKCALSGQELTFSAYRKKLHSASLDRKDSEEGYTLGNVQWGP